MKLFPAPGSSFSISSYGRGRSIHSRSPASRLISCEGSNSSKKGAGSKCSATATLKTSTGTTVDEDVSTYGQRPFKSNGSPPSGQARDKNREHEDSAPQLFAATACAQKNVFAHEPHSTTRTLEFTMHPIQCPCRSDDEGNQSLAML